MEKKHKPTKEVKLICNRCGFENEPNAKKCANCKSDKFAPPWVIAKRPINRQVSVEITTSDPQYGPTQKRITLSKWWPGNNTTFHIPTLRQWRLIKRIIDKEYSPLLDWESREDYESETQLPELPEDIQELDLSDKDIKDLSKLLPILLKYDIKNVGDIKKLIAAKKVFHYVHLEKVLKEFARQLKTEATETMWQTFFKQNLLILNPGYIEKIEKANISLSIKFPDFLLLNIEGYVDIYEIKVPDTELLKYDKSHNNYYWSPDIAKAISQVENYVEELNTFRNDLIVEIERQYGLTLKVVRPRGFVIAGHSRQLKDSQKNDCFRLLNECLTSTRILPYDNFLETFKNFSKILKQQTK